MTPCYVRHETAPGVHADIPHEHERLDMSETTSPQAEIERLRKLNDGLSRQIIAMGDTLESSRRELLATGWDECAKSPTRPRLKDNPYRKPVIDLSGAIICKTRDDA